MLPGQADYRGRSRDEFLRGRGREEVWINETTSRDDVYTQHKPSYRGGVHSWCEGVLFQDLRRSVGGAEGASIFFAQKQCS